MNRAGTAAIRGATARDRAALLSLLREAGLPTEGVPESLEGFVVAETPDGAIVGGAAIEGYGDKGLLRSLVVAPSCRGIGLGQTLTEHVITGAGDRGITDLYLLTTTAERFFPRFGFRPITRAVVPPAVQGSAEFQGACPSTAAIMHRALRGK
ncbi:MAG TPA: arsenic resistance N-acetyltransferase ArsN2 [Gemmatimonadales bacterium]|nr:arsenic resistance N-acetyltransferase ArsN2 [Gemmatimonadales bacterium]